MESAQPPYSAQHPWLVICFGGELENQTFFSVSEDRYYMRHIPELKEKIIRAYADEWLLLESIYSSDCYLWNLISNDKIHLPPLPTECEIMMCLLSAPPHDPECQILFLIKETENVDEDEDEDVDVDVDDENDDENDEDDDETDEDVNPPTLYFCKPGYNEEFHKQDVQSIIGDWRLGIWTVFKRKFYILTCKTHALLCLDPDNDSGRITVTLMANEFPIMFGGYLDMNRYEKYIIQSSNASDDMLFYVHLYFNGKDHAMPYHFQVLKFDFEKKMWIETESIGEIAIFVSYSTRTGTTCSTRGTNLNGESIYFTDGRYLYVYNLITHSISLSLPCPHVPKKNPYMHWLTLN
uniref:KIB1-4 beta-propeller domain-containing protein n=1 Tax=Solanum tuberosum TaxID=4113 RepID=M0ZS33_SOLTU